MGPIKKLWKKVSGPEASQAAMDCHGHVHFCLLWQQEPLEPCTFDPQAVSLERFAADLAIVLAVDWMLDRCRTAVNLMSDALAVVVVDYLCRNHSSYMQIEMA